MVSLTEQQGKALELGRHISVTANAGSGKTRVLVERYVAAVRSGTGVEQILCLTFTEKAALELREKIGARINSEYDDARKSGAAYAAALRDARDKLLEANISTIHSFCSQTLREFPIEAGVDANFKVLEDFDASSMKEDSCAEAVRISLAEERPDSSGTRKERNAHNFLVRIGYVKALELLVELLNNREKIEHLKLKGRRILPDEETIRRHWMNLTRVVSDVIRLNVSRKNGDFSEEMNALNDLIASETGTPGPLLAELRRTLDKILTKAGTPRKRDVVIEGGATYSYDDALSALQTASIASEDVSEESIASDMSGYVRLLGTIADLYAKSEEIYGRKKFLMGALDFDDLQIFTLRLLAEKQNVRETLVSRFKHVMVDEFQDTNFLQYEIFLNLIDNFASEARLFVVGDPKQSIYRFRNAQVEVSEAARENLSKIEDGLNLPLSESFRMNSDIAAFVNDIFPEVLRGSRVFGLAGFPSMDQTAYNALIPRRPGGASQPVEIFVKEKGNREETDAEEDETDEVSEKPVGDPQSVFAAARIREMVNSGEVVRSVGNNEREKQISYGDIAVLMRTRARLPLLEDAFTKYGVPYVVSAGIGFYSAQEIFDLTNYLTFLLDNNDDISLFGVLRSPFFGISENELYSMSLAPGESLLDRLRLFAGSSKCGDEVKYASTVLEEEIQLAQRLTIPQLINRILERTGWLGAYRLSPTGDQRLANLRKLLAIAREFEGRGFNSLYDFIERIRYLKETAREGQAPIDETVDAVKIMTVHAAKGLEFPVVVIPFCDAFTRRGARLIVNDHVGILPFVGNEIPAAFSLYKCLESTSEQAEIARLFYVACTRAMDKLILTTIAKKAARNINSFADILTRSLDLSSISAEGYLELPGVKIKIRSEIPQVHAAVDRKPAPEKGPGEIFLDPVPAGIDGEFYSATLLQTFKLCPTKYFLRYRLGMPTPEIGDGEPETGDRRQEPGDRGVDSSLRSTDSGLRLEEHDDSILATVKGSLVHSVLERAISSGKTDDEAIETAAKQAIEFGVARLLNEEATRELTRFVIENARNAIATLKTVGQTGKRYTEQTITRKFGSDFLTGTLDLLIEDDNGYHIYDYKTNRLEVSDEQIYSGYETQMKLYASLCGNLKPGQDKFDVTIIFTREAGKHLRKTYSKKDLSDFETELRAAIEEMKKMESDEGAFPSTEALPSKSPHCGECEYYVGDGRRECLLARREVSS